MIELLGAAVALIGTSIVSYTDYKTGYMPDRYTHAMILIGMALLFFHSGGLSAALGNLLVAGLVFGACFLAYIFGQLGGGDVKLFTAMALLVPFYSFQLDLFGLGPVAAPYPFVVSVFFGAAVFAMFFVSVGYAHCLIKDRKKIKGFNRKAAKGIAYSVLVLPLAGFWAYLNINMLFIAPPLVVGAFVLAFTGDILKMYVVAKKKVKDLDEDDVIAIELLSKAKLKKLGIGKRKTFLDSELPAIKRNARKHGIGEVWVSEHLPRFGPYILASLLLNLLVGDALLWILLA